MNSAPQKLQCSSRAVGGMSDIVAASLRREKQSRRQTRTSAWRTHVISVLESLATSASRSQSRANLPVAPIAGAWHRVPIGTRENSQQWDAQHVAEAKKRGQTRSQELLERPTTQ